VPVSRARAELTQRKYPNLVSGAQRAAAKRAITTLESALGGHTMPMDVWIDHSKLVPRMSFTMAECGLTPLMAGAMQNIKFGCNGSSG
jgi:hypothetical protein